MNARITVSILTYNSGATIRACLDALVAQTDRDFAVHIIDDASTDDTRVIIGRYADKLDITIFDNGTHNIPHGRNIALQHVPKGICAFTDSDDTVDHKWVATIRQEFAAAPGLAMIAGQQVTSYRTRFARSIAANDETMRRLFGGGVLQFCTCNCAINRDVLPGAYFNELFKNGEDIEFAARVEKEHEWKFVDELKVHHTTRDTITAYASQMYLYGAWKLFFSYATRTLRPVDFIPLVYGIGCVLLGYISPFFIAALFLLPLAQTAVTIAIERVSIMLWGACFVAWCVKNTSWSIGICRGLLTLISARSFRSALREEGATA